MTHAEKFKEVFGFEFALAPYEADCWCPFQRTKCRDTEFDCFEDCVKPFWQSEYQGEPTIPLSVIEDINKQLEELINKPCTNQNMMAQNLAYRNVQRMIKKQLGEVIHEDT